MPGSGPPRATRRTFLVGGSAAALGLASGCHGDGGTAPPSAPAAAPSTGTPAGAPALGPMVPALRPSAAPVQAGPELSGSPVPSNQWWTSALTGPWTQQMWAVPVVAQAGPGGLALALPTVRVEADHVLSEVVPQVTVGGPLRSVRVDGYGDFSVRLRLARADGSAIGVDLAQGSPVVHLEVPAGPFELVSAGSPPAVDADGVLRLRCEGCTWEVPSPGPPWTVDGQRATATLARPGVIAVAPRPAGAGAAWDAALAAAAGSPVTDTRSTLAVDRSARQVTQSLEWLGGPGLVATTSLQRLAGAVDTDVLGTYATPLGDLHVRAADRLDLTTSLREPPAEVAAIELDPSQRSAVLADLHRDLADATVGAGIYDDAKALGRLALLADVAHRVPGKVAARLAEQAVALLGAGLRDWLSYTGADDVRWLAYEPTWGTVAANPPQFGSQDLNDHHFHFGYLVRAAATLQRLTGGDERGLDADATATVDLLVSDVIGSSGTSTDGHALPRFRVWNAYLGHSAASGFAAFADGNNQESSSEAVHAWEAIADWARIVGDADLLDAAVARYTVESLAARVLWLGEGLTRPVGYDHREVGIVWDGKLDFATFFDPRPEAVIGIQLLPFTPGSAYRGDAPGAAAARVATARAAGGGTPRLWPDLFLMEEAFADPGSALAALDRPVSIEAGNSRTWLRWWVLTQQAGGQVVGGVEGGVEG